MLFVVQLKFVRVNDDDTQTVNYCCHFMLMYR